MEILNYLITSVIAYLGLACGIALSFIAEEELRDGKKYFMIMQDVTAALVLFAMLYYMQADHYINFFVSIAFLALLMSLKKVRKSLIIYPLMGIVFYMASFNAGFPLQAALIFLYGLPTASLLFDRKHYLRILAYHLPFLAIAWALYLL